ncbi:putative entry exclusion protein TrbK-alt [Paracoccus onubensis]|uniref:putative entry exclusion protein TrbK-alt n=1 Tax=Paracoccus onubensis TaxID=1675788 RepID=UPI00273164C1|nr:putative entry exclusion protein TrbK-alt [Paracoccus onubensis]MDP0926529.1 putative entry exclusion protein TrbK-alt [Paracoccus onubensis]
MHDPFWPRVLAILLLAVAMTVTVIQLQESGDLPESPGPEIRLLPEDPLHTEQRRCQQMGKAAAKDEKCLNIWAAPRDRFRGKTPDPVAPQEHEGQ